MRWGGSRVGSAPELLPTEDVLKMTPNGAGGGGGQARHHRSIARCQHGLQWGGWIGGVLLSPLPGRLGGAVVHPKEVSPTVRVTQTTGGKQRQACPVPRPASLSLNKTILWHR